ncbi:hypothetical protein GCM10017559_64510 [Streptosporangium longisporum]|uniref:Uncharacterized protein n=1 Tax=Streptosporangium longisporum TaxID=46187 RepID=A0ABP6L0Q8_9ACTN
MTSVWSAGSSPVTNPFVIRKPAVRPRPGSRWTTVGSPPVEVDLVRARAVLLGERGARKSGFDAQPLLVTNRPAGLCHVPGDVWRAVMGVRALVRAGDGRRVVWS